jgi:hypothetical protein
MSDPNGGGQQYTIDAACAAIAKSVPGEAHALSLSCDAQQAEEVVLRVVGLVADALDIVGEGGGGDCAASTR